MNKTQGFPTDVGIGLPLIISALIVLVPSLLLWQYALTSGTSYPRLFYVFWGNAISPIILWFFAAGLIMLGFKYRRFRKQTELLEALEPLLTNFASDARLRGLKAAVQSVAANLNTTSNKDVQTNLLLRRLYELAENQSPAEIGVYDRELLSSSYAFVRFLLWAVPILGFIGTVWGISEAVSAFSDAMSDVSTASAVSQALKDNLPIVTRNLATAFDTTFLALVLSIPLMLLMLWLERTEERFLVKVDELWFATVVSRISTSPSGVVPAQTEPITTPTQPLTVQSVKIEGLDEQLRFFAEQLRALRAVLTDLFDLVYRTTEQSQPHQEPIVPHQSTKANASNEFESDTVDNDNGSTET